MAEDIVLHKHPDYLTHKDAWEKYRVFYDADYDELIKPDYLWPHEFEHERVTGGMLLRSTRERRTKYINLFKPIVRRMVALIFREAPSLEDLRSVLDDFEIDDIDGNGTSLIKFMKDVAACYFAFGHPYILTESYGIQARNRAEEQQLGLRPFLTLLRPYEVLDWDLETRDPRRLGQFNAWRHEMVVTQPRDTLLEKPKQMEVSRMYVKSDSGYKIYRFERPLQKQTEKDSRWILADTAQISGQDELPIVTIQADSYMKDVQPIAELTHNTQSGLDNGLLFQAHQRIFASGNFDKESKLTLNEGVIALLPDGAQINVVDPSQPLSLEKRYDQLVMTMFKVAFMQHRAMPSDSKAVQGADTIREDKDDFVTAMVGAAQDLEDLMNAAMRNYMRFKNRNREWDGKIEFNKDLTIEDVNEQVQILTAHWAEIIKHETWRRECNKSLAQKMNLGNIDEIIREIELATYAGEENRDQRRRSLFESIAGITDGGQTTAAA